jgi:hypothetical protein
VAEPRRAARTVFGGALALGVAIRAADFLRCRSLGLDEARLAINVASRPLLQLLRPLDLDQSAPPLFLWGERLVFRLLGHSDCALRLVPVAAGIAAAMLMYPLARRFLDDAEARLAAIIGVFSPLLITYSNVVKQYSFELLIAVLLLLLLERELREEGGSGRGAVLAAGVIAPWASLTSVFVLATGWAVVAGRAARRRPGAMRLAAASAVAWGTSGAIAYATVYRAASRNPYMHRFWELAFLTPARPGFAGHAWKTVEDQVWGFVAGDPLVDRRPFLLLLHVGTLLVVILCLLGCRRILRTRGFVACWWLCGPAVLTAAASMLGLFPIAPRLTLFLLPGAIVLFVAGLGALVGSATALTARRRLAVAAVVLVLPMEFQAVARASAREPSADFRSLVRTLLEHRTPGEPVYVFVRSLPAWIYYSTDWSRPDTSRLRFLTEAVGSTGGAFENARSRGRVRMDEVRALSSAIAAPGELLGLPSGMEWREVQEHVRMEPDSGWVDVERRRIEGAAAPSVWVIASTFYAPEGELFAALERDARRRTYDRSGNGSILARYEFGRAISSDGSSGPAGDQSNSPASLGRRSTVTSAGR